MSVTFAPKLRAILPRQIVVFVRIPGCSSLDVFARHFSSSPLMIRSDNLVTIVRTALTVCSRSSGAMSVKPVAWDGQQKRVFRVRWRMTNHVWEDFIIDNLLRQMINHVRQILE